MQKKLNVIFFFNGLRGYKIFRHIKKNKIINNTKVFLAKKNLISSLSSLKNAKIIKSLDDPEVVNYLKKFDLAISGGFPYIFKERHLKLIKYGIINCHAGVLPKYRGGSPLNWQIINNEKYFGISTLLVNEKIDCGDIIKEKKFILKKKYKIMDLHKIVNKEFPFLVEKSIFKLINKKKLKKQKNNKSYFKQRSNEDSYLDFKNKKFTEIFNFVRALQKPYPKPYFFYQNKRVVISKIKKIQLKLKPGEIKKINKIYIIGCKNSSIQVT